MATTDNLIILKNKYTLLFKDFYFRCCIGKNGLTLNKVEGDHKTPRGTYELGDLFYRKDKIKKPQTDLLCRPIKPQMGWCNDINNLKNYNKLVNKKKITKSEKLFRKDYKYNYIIPINYNSPERIPKKGSAIFIHLTKKYRPTAGCIALNEKDLIILLKLINKKTKIKIF
jgi:L,D-peptidoglycan transpeptidase YkuD (ErfK/YbiS/YcfS/YnhG family)